MKSCETAGRKMPATSRNSPAPRDIRSEEHTSELQSPCNLVCRLLLEKKKKKQNPLVTWKHDTRSSCRAARVPLVLPSGTCAFFFFFNDTATTEIYTLSLHDALPICSPAPRDIRGPPADRATASEWLRPVRSPAPSTCGHRRGRSPAQARWASPAPRRGAPLETPDRPLPAVPAVSRRHGR